MIMEAWIFLTTYMIAEKGNNNHNHHNNRNWNNIQEVLLFADIFIALCNNDYRIS